MKTKRTVISIFTLCTALLFTACSGKGKRIKRKKDKKEKPLRWNLRGFFVLIAELPSWCIDRQACLPGILPPSLRQRRKPRERLRDGSAQ